MNESISQKPPRAERPDKPLFFAMMGAFFLFFALAPAYWAYYNYSEYDRTDELLRRWSQQPELMPKDSYGGNPFAIQTSRMERYKLEMSLSGFGSFILFGIAAFLFTKSFKTRNAKNFYREINQHEFPPPNARIEVRYKNFQNVLLAGLSFFFVALAALLFYQTLTSQFSTMREIVVKGAFCLSLPSIVLFLVFLAIRARRRSVKIIDNSGVIRGDGRHFVWTEFCGVVSQTGRKRFGGLYVWRKELAFANGESAWLIPNRIKNAAEVFQYVDRLPAATPES